MSEITIRDIARECGVGISTVSRAMNNHPDINPGTRQHILEVIRQTGFVPNNSARNLKRTEAKSVAVLLKGITNPLFASMIKGIEEEIQRNQYVLEIRQVEFDEDEMDVAAKLIKEKRLKGIIFLGGYFCHAREKMENLKVPYVFGTVGTAVPRQADITQFSSVSVDDRLESRRLVSYLVGLGHRRIVLISAESDADSIGQLRLKGYREALEEKGIAYEADLVVQVQEGIEHYSMENGYETMKQFLHTDPTFTAVFATADILAAGVCRALLEAGVNIPGDVSVAGFDGIDISKYYHPSITTICQPVKEMAASTAGLLFDMISGEKRYEHRIFPGELAVRESTGVCLKYL